MADTDTFGRVEPELITKLSQISDNVLGELALYLSQVGLRIPITQIDGFSEFTVQAATPVNTAETTTSLTYVNLATVGPTLSMLGRGSYVFFYGAALYNSGSTTKFAIAAPSYNGATPSDSEACFVKNTDETTVMRAAAHSFTTDNNSVTLKYRVDGGTGTYDGRWLMALKYANA